MKRYAPIVVFTYIRPKHFFNLLNSLAQCEEAKFSNLIVFSDGAKDPQSTQETKAIEEVRDICLNERRFNSVQLIKQDTNQGLANSIIGGVTTVIEKYGSVIVLEDDLIVSPYFLKFMNEALEKYELDERVGQIGACNFFACGSNFPKAFFVPIPDCWGWATWKKNWNQLIKDPKLIFETLQQNKELSFKFNGYGSYDFISLLRSNTENKVDSWAILWHATCILNNWLTLYPNPSLTNHIESVDATHANFNIVPPLVSTPIDLQNTFIEEKKEVIEAMKLGYSGNGDYFGNLKNRISLWQHIANF